MAVAPKLDFTVDASELLDWARRFDTVPKRTKGNVARALNTAGQALLMTLARQLSEETGLPFDEILRDMSVEEATPENLEWSVDATGVAERADSAAVQSALTADDEGDDEMLVTVLTANDELVCEICRNFQLDGPHTKAEVREFAAAHHANVPARFPSSDPQVTNLLHPNCRCHLHAWAALRRLPVSVGKTAITAEVTVTQLGKMIADALRGSITAKF